MVQCVTAGLDKMTERRSKKGFGAAESFAKKDQEETYENYLIHDFFPCNQ